MLDDPGALKPAPCRAGHPDEQRSAVKTAEGQGWVPRLGVGPFLYPGPHLVPRFGDPTANGPGSPSSAGYHPGWTPRDGSALCPNVGHGTDSVRRLLPGWTPALEA